MNRKRNIFRFCLRRFGPSGFHRKADVCNGKALKESGFGQTDKFSLLLSGGEGTKRESQ